MVDWATFTLALVAFTAVQWTLLLLLPMSLTYYEGNVPKRRKVRLGRLLVYMARHRVEMHGPLLYVDLGHQRGTLGAHWAVFALAWLIVGPWVEQSNLR